jgi:hypothetical protein
MKSWLIAAALIVVARALRKDETDYLKLGLNIES